MGGQFQFLHDIVSFLLALLNSFLNPLKNIVLTLYVLFIYNLSTLLDILLLLISFGFVLYIISLMSFKFISFNSVIKFFTKFWGIIALFSFFIIICILVDFFLLNNDECTNYTSNINIQQFIFSDTSITTNINNINIFFIFTISIITVFALQNSLFYMQLDQKKEKFICFLNGFAFSMIGLVITKNFLLMFFFWEFLGITSFFLINHNDTQIQSQKSALKAVSFNKFSDFMFLASIAIFFATYDTLNLTTCLDEILATNNSNNYSLIKFLIIKIALILLFIAATIKSVQIFSFFWLPDSMKAPAPASALIHSATLVAAGFYIIVTFKDLFFIHIGLNFMFYFGIITAVFGAIIAISQYDVKKILAFSTIANCGFMLALLATQNIYLFLIYFVLHGLLKSCCFMLTGNLIIKQKHEQDTRFFFRNNTNSLSIIRNISGMLFCLSGAPFGIVYIIKHSFIINSSTQNFEIFEAFLIIYGILSLLYSLNFFSKAILMCYANKDEINLDTLKREFTVTDLFYAVIVIFVGPFFLEISLTQSIDNYYIQIFLTNWIIRTFISSMLFICFLKFINDSNLFSNARDIIFFLLLFYMFFYFAHIAMTIDLTFLPFFSYKHAYILAYVVFGPMWIYWLYKIFIFLYNLIIFYWK